MIQVATSGYMDRLITALPLWIVWDSMIVIHALRKGNVLGVRQSDYAQVYRMHFRETAEVWSLSHRALRASLKSTLLLVICIYKPIQFLEEVN